MLESPTFKNAIQSNADRPSGAVQLTLNRPPDVTWFELAVRVIVSKV
jgi:hypothetical protein